VGVAYAARGASITTAVKAAEVAATTNTDPQQQTAAVIKVKTVAQLAKSTVQRRVRAARARTRLDTDVCRPRSHRGLAPCRGR